MKQCILRLEQIADHSSSTSSPLSTIFTSINTDLQTQADKIESSIEDTNNRLSEIYASIATLAKSFSAPLSKQWQLQFLSHSTSSSSSSHTFTQSKNTVPKENDMFVNVESSLSHQPFKISTDLSFSKSYD